METTVTKTIRARVWRLTKVKADRLRWLYENWGGTGYRMHDNMALRYPTKKVLNQWAFNLRENPNSIVAHWWVRFAITKGEWRNFPLRMAPEHEALLADPEVKVCNSELIRKGKDSYIHITIQKPVSQALETCNRILAVDIGERNIATSVVLVDGLIREPRFHARIVRGLRRHYAWLRRILQKRGHHRTLVRIKDTERKRIGDLLHKASREIVHQAIREDAVIAIGDLKGIRQRCPPGKRARGKRFARIVHTMPYHRLTACIQYKAAWEGIPVILVGEEYSSKECHVCNNEGKRPSQGLFICSACGWTGHADVNGAANIGKRAFEYILRVGAPESEPEGGQPEFNEDRPIYSLERPVNISTP